MAGLQDIRRRIRSVKNTQQVTKAMKMISAVKLRKSQERLVALRPYASKMMEVVRRVVGRIKGDSEIQPGPAAQAFLSPREEKRIRVVLVASDKGHCRPRSSMWTWSASGLPSGPRSASWPRPVSTSTCP